MNRSALFVKWVHREIDWDHMILMALVLLTSLAVDSPASPSSKVLIGYFGRGRDATEKYFFIAEQLKS